MRVIIVLLGVLAAIAIFSVSDEKLSKKAKQCSFTQKIAT